jgi:hypothetical protein
MTLVSYLELISNLDNRRTRFFNLHLELKSNKPDIDDYYDARHSVLMKCYEAIQNTILGLYYIHTSLWHKEWWDKYCPIDPNSDNTINLKGSFENHLKISFITILFSSIESTLRIISRKLYPNLNNNATAEFFTVYTALLKRLDLTKHLPTLDFFRIIRNTIHNNGVYYHKNELDLSIPYRGKTFIFKIGKPHQHAIWENILYLMDDLLLLITDLLSNPSINDELEIIDPLVKTHYDNHGPGYF